MTGRLIAFTGPAGSGKSTAAEALQEVGWIRCKFADPLKNMMRAYYASCGIDNRDYVEARIEGDLKEEPDPFLHGRTPRHAMQTLGTDWGRNLIAGDLWVTAWEQNVKRYLASDCDVVVDDCRFANEADTVRRCGGHVIRIDGRGKALDGDHASEKFDFEADLVLMNERPLDQFKADVVYIYHRTDCPL